MKFILLIVSAIAVSTAAFRDIPDQPDIVHGYHGESTSTDQDLLIPDGPFRHATPEPEPQNSDFEDQQLNEVDEFVIEETQIPDDSEVDHKIMEEGKRHIQMGLRVSQCSANAICGIVGGSCISNTTRCRGWLVTEGCKSASCKCCIPRSQEMQMTIFTLELESLKEELVNSSLQLQKDLFSMIENVNKTNAEFKEELETKITKKGCPEGLFLFGPSNQCFKFLNATKYNWATANAKCQAQGLELAKPYDPVSLRSYLLLKYSLTDRTWVGAKGTGSAIVWQRDGKKLQSANPYWYSSGSTSTSYCLTMLTHAGDTKNKPTNPYYMVTCSSSYWTLCELVEE